MCDSVHYCNRCWQIVQDTPGYFTAVCLPFVKETPIYIILLLSTWAINITNVHNYTFVTYVVRESSTRRFKKDCVLGNNEIFMIESTFGRFHVQKIPLYMGYVIISVLHAFYGYASYTRGHRLALLFPYIHTHTYARVLLKQNSKINIC